MKAKKFTTGPTPVNPALIQAHGSVYRAMADVNFAVKILSKHADRGAEPGTYVPGRHARIVGELSEMLSDIQRIIGRAALRSAECQLSCKKR